MAGSFDIFRKNQRILLAAAAILAMLAFFVLPPFLQMAPEAGVPDPLVATWQGGGIRQGEMERAVAMRMVLNQFLRDAIAASGRDPATMPALPETEAEVVDTLLLAREADANGIAIGNAAVNQFLAEWTQNMVRPEQFESLIAGRQLGRMPVTTADVFGALRTVLAAERMRRFSGAGFAGDPPGARWDIFRRLEQQATIEVVPVVVESFAGEVPAPAEANLRAFFDRHKNALPVDRSPEPGFKEPHRISFDWVRADRESLEKAAEEGVADAEVETFYEENKVRFYRAKPAAAPPAAGEGGDAGKDATTDKEPAADAKPENDAKPASEAKPEAGAKPDADPKAAAPSRSRIIPAKFRQPQAAPETPAAEKQAGEKPADKPAAEKPAADKPAGDKPAEARGPDAPGADAGADAATFEPLESVRADIRRRLAARAVARRIDEVFPRITADVAGFARDRARWKANGSAAADEPRPPDVQVIAERQGLEAGRGQKLTAGEAQREGGVGASFQLLPDPTSPLGFRQARWTDLAFAADRPEWRPVETSSVTGDRFLSWKTEDVPAFVPEFAAVRADVERAWRIVEARPLARAAAERLAAAATGNRSLADVVASGSGQKLEAVRIGPFTWLSRGGAFGSAPAVSQPDGLEMPGTELMRAVFGLEPGGTAVAFNEPRTVCYAIRLVEYTPPEDDLRRRFVDSAADQRRLEAVAQREQAAAAAAWMSDLRARAELEWKRPPDGR